MQRQKSVTTVHPSLKINSNLNNFNQTPLERNRIHSNFKGVPFSSGKDFLFKLLRKPTKEMSLKTAVNTIKNYIGKAEALDLNSLITNPHIKGRIKITENDGEKFIQFFEKTPLALVIDGLKYPFVNMPFQLMRWGVENVEKIKIFRNSKPINAIKNWKTYQNNAAKVQNSELLNSLRGLVETANKYKFDSEELKSLAIFSNQSKMFSPKTGNYNSVHERSLNRIVSGYIPAFFLANDAYNLSSLCDNDPQAAKKEKKLRFNQEIKRVSLNAYIQLITLGALSKYINRSKQWIVGTIGATVLITETYSRLSNGKSITFLSSKRAQEINERNKCIEKEECEQNTQKQDKLKQIPSFKNQILNNDKPQVFKNFEQSMGLAETLSGIATNAVVSSGTTKENITNELKNSSDDKKELKPLLSFDTVLKASAAIIVAGLALKQAKKIKFRMPGFKTEINFGKIAKNIKDTSNKIYEALTSKTHYVDKEKFNELVKKIERCGFEKIAENYRKIAEEYQRSSTIKNFAANESDKHIMNLRDKVLSLGFKKELDLITKIDTKKLQEQNFLKFIEELKNEGLENIADKCNKIFFDKTEKSLENKYTKIFKLLKKDNKTTLPTSVLLRRFENVFKINDDKILIKNFKKLINSLHEGGYANLADDIEKLVIEAETSSKIYLGKKDRYLIKELVDFIKQPFKFLWQTVEFPYRLMRMFTDLFNPMKLPKYDNGIKSLSNNVEKLIKTIGEDDELFAKKFATNTLSSFNNVTMSGVSNAELSNLARFASKVATMWFLVADNYNMVMLKSDGKNKKQAELKAKERFVQEISRIFYATMFINLFNNTFRKAYNYSLLGMTAVTAACTLVGEYVARVAIGMPVSESSQKEIMDKERANFEDEGIKGKFYRFMSRLTGKKVLTQREQK